ncbi:hypothetical protein [Micromonospora sp. NBC_00421]|uniref:hypothetical protein n=1 Tax=Micromonospora sp. NBC_00421 TaxID=2975976 RepID=UPI002E1E1701
MTLQFFGCSATNNGRDGFHFSQYNQTSFGADWTEKATQAARLIGEDKPGVAEFLQESRSAPSELDLNNPSHFQWWLEMTNRLTDVAKIGTEAVKVLAPLGAVLWSVVG